MPRRDRSTSATATSSSADTKNVFRRLIEADLTAKEEALDIEIADRPPQVTLLPS